MKYILSCLLLFCSINIFAQKESIILGKRQNIHSQILNEDRSYYLSLPENYDANKAYPVMLLLDAEMYFPVVSAIQQNLAKRSPEAACILVGINNTARTRDLTPSAAISQKGGATMENSGGGEQFFQFINKEVLSQVRKNYKTSNRNIVVGHSFGALFSYYLLLKHQDVFSDFVLIEPSMWYDDNKWLLEGEKDVKAAIFLPNSHAFFGFAGNHVPEIGQAFPNLLQALKEKGVDSKLNNYPDENHGSLFIPSVYDGLRFIWNIRQIERYPGAKKQ